MTGLPEGHPGPVYQGDAADDSGRSSEVVYRTQSLQRSPESHRMSKRCSGCYGEKFEVAEIKKSDSALLIIPEACQVRRLARPQNGGWV
jgi:hypothetical protein